VPAPAVIPAPRAYVKVVAVKKLVVGLQCGELLVRQKRRALVFTHFLLVTNLPSSEVGF